jgi:1-aminocyclopropane-1-carboxylate deaminase/D-cysteine desulfhydrase-like pyridoxal-dependent ACC family enzyme
LSPTRGYGRRFPLGVLPTPLHRGHRLERALDCGPLLLKRDDLIGFGAAGNKARPLEYLVGAALAEGAEVLVTGGAPSSNFCAAAALAARVARLECELLIAGETGGAPNMALARAACARLVPTGAADRTAIDGLVAARAGELTAAGRPAYGVPRGGSTPLGAVGFAVAAKELLDQCAEPPALVVLGVGSGGSCAGLLAGLAAADIPTRVLGVSVSRPPDAIAAHVDELARGCATLLGTRAPTPGRLELVDARGAGFGTASPRERERAAIALHAEGLLLDGTYGAQAFSAAVDRLPTAEGPVVYWHTGGLAPAIAALISSTG